MRTFIWALFWMHCRMSLVKITVRHSRNTNQLINICEVKRSNGVSRLYYVQVVCSLTKHFQLGSIPCFLLYSVLHGVGRAIKFGASHVCQPTRGKG